MTTINYRNSNYWTTSDVSSGIYANNSNYENLLINKDDFIDVVAIPSKVISDSYLKIFIVFSENTENNIFTFNKDLKPKKDARGLGFNYNINPVIESKESIKRVYLKTFNDVYSIRIDTTNYKSDFILAQNKKEQLGFESYISIKDLSEGKHLLNITQKTIQEKDTISTYVKRIPFWHYKD